MNFHPPLVSIPVAFLLALCILELLCFIPKAKPFLPMLRFTIRLNTVFCFVGILAAFFSGYLAEESASQSFQVPGGAIGDHHMIGRFLLFASIPWLVLCFCRDFAKFNRALFTGGYYLLLVTCLGLTIYCGYLGGNLVFRYGAGVNLASPPF